MKNDNSNTSLKRGRPPKKDYDAEALMRELIDTAAEIYREKGEIKATAWSWTFRRVRSKSC